MRLSNTIAIVAALCAGCSLETRADDADWNARPVVDVVDVSIAIVETPRSQLRALANRHGQLDAYRVKGLSVLVRDTVTGAFRCTVYVLDMNDEETIEHELRHCEGYTHD